MVYCSTGKTQYTTCQGLVVGSVGVEVAADEGARGGRGGGGDGRVAGGCDETT